MVRRAVPIMATVTVSTPPTMGWQKITVPYTSIRTAALTNNVLILALPAKDVIHRAFLSVTQAFSGTTTLTLSLGIVSDNLKFVTAQSALAISVLNGVALNTASPESMSASTNVNLYAVATEKNLSSLTQGSEDVYLLTSSLP